MADGISCQCAPACLSCLLRRRFKLPQVQQELRSQKSQKLSNDHDRVISQRLANRFRRRVSNRESIQMSEKLPTRTLTPSEMPRPRVVMPPVPQGDSSTGSQVPRIEAPSRGLWLGFVIDVEEFLPLLCSLPVGRLFTNHNDAGSVTSPCLHDRT